MTAQKLFGKLCVAQEFYTPYYALYAPDGRLIPTLLSLRVD